MGRPACNLYGAPHVWDADRDAAAAELALVAVNGVNLWTTIAVALDDVHVGHPQAFGPVDDPVDEERQRQAPQARAAAALRDVSSLPVELLCGLAVIRGVAVEPRANLAERMVADEMADAPRLAPCSVPLT